MELVLAEEQLELPGNPVLWTACFVAISVVKYEHDFTVARPGNLGQLLRRNMFGASWPILVDACIGVKEQIMVCVICDVSYHRLSRKPYVIYYLGQHRLAGQSQKLRIMREVKPPPGGPPPMLRNNIG